MRTKRSVQKEAIIEYLKSVDTHPNADEIYDNVRKKVPDISLGTVYRNLKKMTQSGEILRIGFDDGGGRFDGNPKPHYHFNCVKCLRVYDIKIPYIDELDERISKITENSIHGHTLMFRGVCKNCKSKD